MGDDAKQHEIKEGSLSMSVAMAFHGLDHVMTPEQKAEALIGLAGVLASKAKKYGTPEDQVRQILEVALEAVR